MGSYVLPSILQQWIDLKDVFLCTYVSFSGGKYVYGDEMSGSLGLEVKFGVLAFKNLRPN